LERSSEEDVGITENVFALKRPAQAGVVRERSSKKPAASAHPPGRGRHGSAHPDHRGSQSRSGGKGNERERKRQGRKDGQITRPVKRPFFWRGLFGVSTARCRRCPDKLSSAAATPPLIRKAQPYTKKIAHKGIWVEPELLAEIEYRAKSAEGKVRHPFYKGLREDL
jgi:ATP dependent DNA ligase C terminal region